MPGQVTVCNRLVRVAHPDQNALRGEAISRQGGCGGIPTDPRTGAWEVSGSTQVSGKAYRDLGRGRDIKFFRRALFECAMWLFRNENSLQFA